MRQRARRLLHLLEALRLHPLPHRLRIRPRPVPKTPLAQTISPTAVATDKSGRRTGQGTLVAAYEKDFSRPASAVVSNCAAAWLSWLTSDVVSVRVSAPSSACSASAAARRSADSSAAVSCSAESLSRADLCAEGVP